MTVHDNTVPAIDCVDFVRLVDDLVDSDPQTWGAVVAKHLDECPPCLVYLQQMRDLKILLNHVYDGQKLTDEHVVGSSARSTPSGKANPDEHQRAAAATRTVMDTGRTRRRRIDA